MGGKAQRRREKNHRAAHGGNRRLPPPPDASSFDVLPSKLRQIMAFANSPQSGSAKASGDVAPRNKGAGSGSNSRGIDKKTNKTKREGDDGDSKPKLMDHSDEIVQNSMHEKKRKRKRKQVDDLRFEAAEELGVGLKRKERKKKWLQERKKKHKKVKPEENLDFPGHEKIRFGEVVEAPPKLVTVPNARKTTHDALKDALKKEITRDVSKERKTIQDASKERLRLEAVDAYRNRKKWTSRPGLHLPLPEVTTPLL